MQRMTIAIKAAPVGAVCFAERGPSYPYACRQLAWTMVEKWKSLTAFTEDAVWFDKVIQRLPRPIAFDDYRGLHVSCMTGSPA